MNHDELAALPPIVDVPTAARVLGIGRSLAYDLVRRDEWPTKVLRIGRLIKIPSAPLLALLGERDAPVAGADGSPRATSADRNRD